MQLKKWYMHHQSLWYLYVVAPVWWRNHIEVKLIARPKNPLSVITNQKMGNLKSGLHFKLRTIRELISTDISQLDNRIPLLSTVQKRLLNY